MPTELDIYHQLLKATKHTILFQQKWWLDTVLGEKNWQFKQWKNKDGELVGQIIPLEKKWGFQFSRTPKLTPYLPLLGNWNAEDLEKAIENISDFDECNIALPPSSNEIIANFEIEDGIHLSKRKTHLLSLENTETALWHGLSHQRKRHLKKANKNLSFTTDELDLHHFILHHQKAFGKKGNPYPFSLAFLEKIIVAGRKNKALFTEQAFFEGKLIGQIVCFYDEHTAYYLLGSIDRDFAAQNPMTALMFHALHTAKNLGLKTFDFEGSSDAGIARFFSEFGSEAQDYFVLSKIKNPIWKLKKKWMG